MTFSRRGGFLLIGIFEMGQINDTIAVYERLREKTYKIEIENGITLTLSFLPENYHHLVGYQHLTDIADISRPRIKQKFYNDLKKHQIEEKQILNSVKFQEISERIKFFSYIEEIVSAGESKVIVEFDKLKSNSEIIADFHLFRREGNPLEGRSSYYILFIGYDSKKQSYYPATFIVEHSPKYVRNQTVYNCTISEL